MKSYFQLRDQVRFWCVRIRSHRLFYCAISGGGGRAKDVKWKIDLLGTVEELFKAEGDAVVQGFGDESADMERTHCFLTRPFSL